MTGILGARDGEECLKSWALPKTNAGLPLAFLFWPRPGRGGVLFLGMSDGLMLGTCEHGKWEKSQMCDEHEKVHLCASEDFLGWLRVSNGFHGVALA